MSILGSRARSSRRVSLLALAILPFCNARDASAAPPGEAVNLRWCAGPKDCLQWDPSSPPGHYRVHRGTRSTFPDLANGVADSCSIGTFSAFETGPQSLLSESPSPGELFWYLVVATNCAADGPAGNGASGPRIVNASGDCGSATCSDGLWNGTETAVDCGGVTCPDCTGGGSCCSTTDCDSSVCLMDAELGVCAPYTCANAVVDGNETDVDCGGNVCPSCGTNMMCILGSDCQSQVCGGNGRCSAPTCTDAAQNGSETDIDCGGGVCLLCAVGDTCVVGNDCAGGSCEGGVCDAGSCQPGLQALHGDEKEPPNTPTACPTSGNSRWTYSIVLPPPHLALDSPDIYVASGSRMSKISFSSRVETASRDFTGVTLGRPIVFDRTGLNLSVVAVAGSNGFVYGLNPSSPTFESLWSRNTRRAGCTTDTITAPIVVQKRDLSDATYRAARSMDIVMVGTDYQCSTSTANKVLGVSANDSTIVWTFNGTAAYQVDTFHGLALDYARNRVYAVSEKDDPSRTQNTVWALSSITGAKLWSLDLDSIDAEPVLANGGLYVGTRSGILYKLNPDNGSTIWQHTVTTVDQITEVVADASSDRVYVVDSGGILHAVLDSCSGAAPAWSVKPLGRDVTAAPAVFNEDVLYAGTDDGRLFQVRASDGVLQAWVTVQAGVPSSDPIVFHDPHTGLLGTGGYVEEYCAPWPHTGGAVD